MRKGDYCIRNIRKLVDEGCISLERARELEKWQEFRKQYPDLSALSEKACRPLMREKDLEVQAKAIEVTGRQVSHGPRETAQQIKTRIANIEAGKGLQGGKHLGKQEEPQKYPVGDKGGCLDKVPEGKDPEDVQASPDVQSESLEEKLGKLAEYCVNDNTELEESEFIEVDSDKAYPYEGDNPGDIPDMPDGASLVVLPRPIAEPIVVEAELVSERIIGRGIPKVTAKITKENLKNAGHVDALQKPKKGPTEDGKQALFAKMVMQALDWGMDGDEIFRRIETAIMFAIQKDREEKVVCT